MEKRKDRKYEKVDIGELALGHIGSCGQVVTVFNAG